MLEGAIICEYIIKYNALSYANTKVLFRVLGPFYAHFLFAHSIIDVKLTTMAIMTIRLVSTSEMVAKGVHWKGNLVDF